MTTKTVTSERGYAAMKARTSATGAKVGVLIVTLLCVFWLMVSLQRSALLLSDPALVTKIIGAGYLLLPLVGVWAISHEIAFGFKAQRMGRVLEREGGLPIDDLPRSPAGRIIRVAADEQFSRFKADVKEAPQDWRRWYRLSCAYDAAGDRKRARQAMRKAARIQGIEALSSAPEHREGHMLAPTSSRD